MKTVVYIIFISIFITGCNKVAPKPKVDHKKQYVNKTVTINHFKVLDFKKMIESDDSIEPMYIYIKNSLQAEASSSDLPDIKKMTYSLLSDFGNKIIVITSNSKYEQLLKDPIINSRLFELDGALTSYDKSIESSSASTTFNLSIGSGDDKVKNRDRFKDKNKTSQIISDFYLKQNGIIEQKTTSSIFVRETNKGYQFGLSFYGVSLGVSSYKNKKDGLGLSTRKIVEASMIDLIAKSIGIKTFQVIPEIQATKSSKKITHLSNFDFCSDINKLVFYTHALKDHKFNSYGITNKSELNKLECLKDLYEKNKNILIKIKAVSTKGLSLSQTQRNVHLIRKKISSMNIPRDKLIIKNKKNSFICKKEPEYCNFVANRVEVEKVLLR